MSNEDQSIAVIERCRQVFRGAAEQLEGKGVSLDDVAIALFYAAEDVASRHHGNHHLAIEWLRTALDLQERQLLGGSQH